MRTASVIARYGVDPTSLPPGAICLQLARFNGMLQSGPVPVPLLIFRQGQRASAGSMLFTDE